MRVLDVYTSRAQTVTAGCPIELHQMFLPKVAATARGGGRGVRRCSCRYSDAARSASPRPLIRSPMTTTLRCRRRSSSRRQERDDDDERRLGPRERWTLPSPSPLDHLGGRGLIENRPHSMLSDAGDGGGGGGMGKEANVSLARGLLSVCAGPDEKVARRVHGDEPDRRIGRQRRRPARLHSLLEDNPVPRWIHAEPGREERRPRRRSPLASSPNRHPPSPPPSSTSTKTSKPGWPASLPTGASRTRHGCTRAGRFWRCAGPSSSGGRIGGSGSSGSSRRGCNRR